MQNSILTRVFGSISGHSSVAVSLIPLSLVLASMLCFGVLQNSGRRYRDAEVAERHTLALVGSWPSQYFSWATRPLLSLLRASGLGAGAVTLMSLHLAVGAAAAIATNHLGLGGWLFVLSGTCDFLDGKLARATNSASPSGAVLDSVIDRYVDAVVWIGLAWLYRGHWMLIAVLFAELGSFAVPYVRARVEALNTPMAQIGSFQRPERVGLLAIGLIGSPICDWVWKAPAGLPPAPLLTAAIILIGLASQLCAFQRLIYAQSVLDDKIVLPVTHGQVGLSRTALAASLATVVDLAFTLWFVELGMNAVIATVIGCGLGAIFNFSVNRIWTFESSGAPALAMSRYALVSTFSALFNGGLVALLSFVPGLPFSVAWIMVRLLIGLTWNYPLHRNYVFAYTPKQANRRSRMCERARA